jgi:signal transduction histidine kinase
LRNRVEQVAIELQDRQRLERQVVRAEKQAMLGRLAAGVAHEINNPLGGMQAAIGMYKRHGGDPEVERQTLSLMERGLDQIRHIVSALLIEVKPEQRPLTPQDVDDIAELVAPMLRERELDLHIDNRLDRAVALPAGPVRQILLNLALNAVQAAPAGEHVDMHVSQDDTTLRIHVSNSGPEIPAERLGRLFEPFDSRDGDESSLGLWLTHLTVTQLNGRIDAGSSDGRTDFTVRLPLGEAV